jgi:hypothetical protein
MGEKMGGRPLRLDVDSYDAAFSSTLQLQAQPGVLGLKAENGRMEIAVDRGEESLDGIIKLFSGAKITDIDIKEPDLEDVFIELAR